MENAQMSSKKEEQRRIREEKQALAKRRDKVAGVVWKAALVVVLPLIVFVLYQGLRSNAQIPSPAEVAANDHVRGPENAPVTLTLYADFQCPACGEEAQYIGRAWSQIGDRTRLVFRHYPLDTHRNALLAARYAEAAARQGRFWEMHDVLYGNQPLWSNSQEAASLFDGYAGQLGMDLEQLRADVDDPAVREKILADQRGGTRAGVRGTPTLFVNGRMVATPRSATEVVALVTRAVRDSN